jgi:hypothetical protein
MKNGLLLCVLVLASMAGKVHPSTPADARDRSDRIEGRGFERPAFWGTTLVNLPTTRTLDRGNFLLRISHRFLPPVSSGRASFAGLDGPAYILLSLGYGITDNLMARIGRSNLNQEWELGADYAVLDQARTPASPLSCTLHAGGDLVTEKRPPGAGWSGRFRLSALASLSRQINGRLSLLAVPAYSSNTDFRNPSSEGTFSLGLGGRIVVYDDISLIGEWVPVLAGYKDVVDGWGLGIEKKIGGHVFQVFATDCYGLMASQYLTGGDLGGHDTGFGDKLRFGFNIFRTM